MSIKIDDEKFYIVEAEKDKWIYGSEKEAINFLKKLISENKNLGQDNMNVFEVDTREEKWQIRQLSWSKIAIELIRGEH
jgi:hypothetical protein